MNPLVFSPMMKLRSSWRPVFFWLLLMVGLAFLFHREPRLRSLNTQYRELVQTLSHGDLSLLRDRGVMRTTAQVLVITSLAVSILSFLFIRMGKSLYFVVAHRYEINDITIIARHGLIARDYREGYRVDFRNASLKQSVLDRLFGVGDLAISTGGTSGLVILFKKISSPLKLKRAIFEGHEQAPQARVALPPPPPPVLKVRSEKKTQKSVPEISSIRHSRSMLESKIFDDEEESEDSLTQVDPDT